MSLSPWAYKAFHSPCKALLNRNTQHTVWYKSRNHIAFYATAELHSGILVALKNCGLSCRRSMVGNRLQSVVQLLPSILGSTLCDGFNRWSTVRCGVWYFPILECPCVRCQLCMNCSLNHKIKLSNYQGKLGLDEILVLCSADLLQDVRDRTHCWKGLSALRCCDVVHAVFSREHQARDPNALFRLSSIVRNGAQDPA